MVVGNLPSVLQHDKPVLAGSPQPFPGAFRRARARCSGLLHKLVQTERALVGHYPLAVVLLVGCQGGFLVAPEALIHEIPPALIGLRLSLPLAFRLDGGIRPLIALGAGNPYLPGEIVQGQSGDSHGLAAVDQV
ncbi:hypothetical protein DNA98_04105 [Meiothermus sp. Pnk-1]|nr:hypothetical protein DNA98_04105 [Meiothermus sp. Pnk-1]